MSFKIKRITLTGLFLVSVIFIKANAQNYSTKDYTNFSINIGVDLLKTSNQKNAISYFLKDPISYNYGLNYIVFSKKVDIVLSLGIRNYNMTNSSNFKGIDIPDPAGYKSETIIYDFYQYKLSGTLNKKIILKDKFELYLGIGPEIIIYPDDPISGVLLFMDDEGTEIGYTENGTSGKTPFYFGINSSLGINFKTKYILINPYILYHFQSKDLYENIVTTQNLYVSENTISKHKVNGNYLSFGVNFYPNKILFKKNKPLNKL